MKKNINKKATFGKLILDSISTGMYNNPLTLYREYIQNSTDSIDEFYRRSEKLKGSSKIEIVINGSECSISIKDNGMGLSSHIAWSVLHNVGLSLKKRNLNRGFRGIGRFSGIGYCEELTFTTKAKGEKVISTSTWDCLRLRDLVNKETKITDAGSVIQKTATFSQKKYKGNSQDRFFIVTMKNVRCSRSLLLNVPAVKNYISQVAPVPFHHDKFSYSNEVDSMLREKVPFYETYNIYVNGEKIFKPYTDKFHLNKSAHDQINGVEYIEITNDEKPLAFGWIANSQWLGKINTSKGIEGIRLRSGNLLVSDKSLLSNFFRENRFNDYLIGEIHCIEDQLILNSRRDDFEDSDHREAFYSAFVREVGLPYSLKIREASIIRNKQIVQNKQYDILNSAKRIYKRGYLTNGQREMVISKLSTMLTEEQGNIDSKKIKVLIDKLNFSKHLLDTNHSNISMKTKKLLKTISEIIFTKCSDKKTAENIIGNIISKIDAISRRKNSVWAKSRAAK